MELVSGVSWRKRMSGGRRIGPAQLAGWMKQLCSAMEAAHARGIVHRDLKPENIMIADDDAAGRAIVLDFGLAKLRSERFDGGLTLSGAVMGTRGYMSPEQRAGRGIDAPTDVFALAVICAESLTGCRPPRAGASVEWLHSALQQAAPGWSPGSATIARSLEHGLAQQPSRRPTAGEFWRELSGALAEAAIDHASTPSQDEVETLSMPDRTKQVL